MDILIILEDDIVVIIIISTSSVDVTMHSYEGSHIMEGPVVGTDRDRGVGDNGR